MAGELKATKAKVDAAGYAQFLAAMKERVSHTRTSAARAVNHELVLLYWDIGCGIVEKGQAAGWGDAVVARLSADLLAAFPDMRGFSAANLWRIKQFYLAHTSAEFLAQAAREFHPAPKAVEKEDFLAQAVREMVAAVPWGHHVLLLGRSLKAAGHLYYLRATAHFGWSRNVLLNQIKALAYERAVQEKKTHNFAWALPEHFAEQAGEMMKSRYNLEFLGTPKAVKERELEGRLIDRLQQFILELGYGFCFLGRQYRLAFGRKEYFVDLLFYLKRVDAPVGVKPALRCWMELSE